MKWLDDLTSRARKDSLLVAGILSGTSADAIDIALCQVSSRSGARVALRGFKSTPYSDEIRSLLRNAASLSVQEVSDLHHMIGDAFGEALVHALDGERIEPQDLDLVGSHGQTVYHHSGREGARRSTLQLGCADVIAERIRRPVFHDFRARDIACGGEGAPLTPYADRVLYAHGGSARAILNLGGIANITALDSSGSRVEGFDCGPANAPLDRLAKMLSQGAQSFDRDGAFARQGRVRDELLKRIKEEDVFPLAKPPKSTGTETYGDEFVQRCISRHGGVDADLMATLVAYVSWCIRMAIQEHLGSWDFSEVVVAGGGSKNPAIMSALVRDLAPLRVVSSDERGVPAHAREAMAFAVLAHDAFLGIPTSIPAVTGAYRPAVLGKLALP